MIFRRLGRTDMTRLGLELRRVGHRRIVGRGGRQRVDARAARGDRCRRQLHRHRGRLRRRPQRAADRAAAARAARARRSTSRPRPAAGCRSQTPDGYTRENLTAWVDRSLREPRRRATRSPAAPLPASRRLRSPGGVRHPRRPRDCRQAAPLRRERRDRGRGDEGDSLPERAERADHLQHVPAQTRRRVLRRGEGAAGRHPRARAARERPAHRQARPSLDVCRRRPPAVQPSRRELRQGRDVLGRAVRPRAWRRSRNCGRSCPAARRWRSSRCAGS